MIGTTKRLITEEKINKSVCNSCKAEDTLLVRVYSKIFILKILPFVYGKEIEIECTHCKKVSENEHAFQAGTKMRIEAVKETANHKWFLYLGYAFIALVMIIGITNGNNSQY